MADDQEINARIKNVQRFKSFLEIYARDKQERLKYAKDFKTFSRELGPLVQDHLGLWGAREDYFGYQNLSIPQEQKNPWEKSPESSNSSILSALGSIAAGAGGVALAMRSSPPNITSEELERNSREYAESQATAWNKRKDFGEARTYFEAYSKAQEKYYHSFTTENPKLAARIAAKSANPYLRRSVRMYNELQKSKSKGSMPTQPAPEYIMLAENRLKMIDKLAELKAKDPAKNYEAERKKLLKSFADNDLVTLSSYLQTKGPEHLNTDPLLKEVVTEKVNENIRTKTLIEKGKRRKEKIKTLSQNNPSLTSLGLSTPRRRVQRSAPAPWGRPEPIPQESDHIPEGAYGTSGPTNMTAPSSPSPRAGSGEGRRLGGATNGVNRAAARFRRGMRTPGLPKLSARGLGKSLGKKAAMTLATNPIVLGGIAIFVVIFLLILIPATVVGRAATDPGFAVQVGLESFFPPTPTPTPIIDPGPDPDPDPGPNPGPAPSCQEIDQRLLADFGVKVTGSQGNCVAKQTAYRIYTIPFSSPKYKDLMKNGPAFTLNIMSMNDPGRCRGARSGFTINMWGFTECVDLKNPESTFLIHETGHIMRVKNPNQFIYGSFNNKYNKFVKEDGSKCYDRGYLKTYSLRCGGSCGITPQSETFSEASALYVYNKKVGSLATINDFKNECPATYKYIGGAVFGGVDL